MNDLTHFLSQNRPPSAIDFDTPALARKRRWRYLMDHLTRWWVLLGGLTVLASITLIFFYLAYVVAPLFKGASLHQEAMARPDWLAAESPALLLAIEEQNRIALRLDAQGQMVFFDALSGDEILRQQLELPPGVLITSIDATRTDQSLVALGLSDGTVQIIKHAYRISYSGDLKTITPEVQFPYGDSPLLLNAEKKPVEHIAFNVMDDELRVAGAAEGQITLLSLQPQEDFLSGETVLQQQTASLTTTPEAVKALYMDGRNRWLYVIHGKATADVFDLSTQTLIDRYALLPKGGEVTASTLLMGHNSLLIGDDSGRIGQWFMARVSAGNHHLAAIRDFRLSDRPIASIVSEQRRKGFAAQDDQGLLGMFHTTAHRTLLKTSVADKPGTLALSPRSDRLLIESDGGFQRMQLDNPHPEISWEALWSKVWYENYDEPRHIWQSTAATNDFEPKLSLAPLTFGTLKAAFYTLLLAAPLAIGAAIYTAYFMTPALRRKIKPVIELMEALPTVILGFFAGLFLAPFVENHLPGLFSLFLLLPIGVLLVAMAWSRLPEKVRHTLPDGREILLLIPVILIIGYCAIALSPWLEQAFFGGDMRLWLNHELGIAYDQRNALIVGIAMGFAVIPTIFSIAEDAVFSVPKNLTYGSLALGASPWQTMTRVVLLTASPGIFSALMIGMGRAVGETMIVLMATGNTPIMEVNLLEGLRTLAANVAVEMPESEVGSSHYRVLFLSALVLLTFTFIMNTGAELVRQRLRKKYASL